MFDASGAAVVGARLPHARVRVLPGLGHLPMMEAPAATAQAYREFLRGGSRGSGSAAGRGIARLSPRPGAAKGELGQCRPCIKNPASGGCPSRR